VSQKVKNLFNYLINVKGLTDNSIKSIGLKDKNVVLLSNYPKDGIEYNPLDEETYIKITKSSGEVYEKIFKIYMSCEREGDNFEIVLGDYIFTWIFQGKKIIYPLVTTRMKMIYSKDTEAFTLSVYDNILNLEIDLFRDKELDTKALISIKSRFDLEFLGIQDQFSINSYIKEIISVLDTEGELHEEVYMESEIVTTQNINVYRMPLIMTRKVDNKLLVSEVGKILKEIDKGMAIPPSMEAIVEEKVLNDPYKNEFKDIANDLMFPLSSNVEQREIVHRLRDNYGVLVQGPPGTGKSHSIANIVCHLLANGKRVLVTSQNAKALKVIISKLPEEIKALCVYQLGEDNTLKEIDSSIRRIDEMTSKNPMEYVRKISVLEEKLTSIRENQKLLVKQIKEIEEIEYQKIKYNGRVYDISDLARWLASEENENSWIEEEIDLKDKCFITDNEMIRFQHLMDKLTREEVENVTLYLENIELIPKKEVFLEYIKKYESLKKREKEFGMMLKSWHVPDNFTIDKDIFKVLDLGAYEIKKIKDSWAYKVLGYYNSGSVSRTAIDKIYVLLKCDFTRLLELRIKAADKFIYIPEDIELSKLKFAIKRVKEEVEEKNGLSYGYKFTHRKECKMLAKCTLNNEKICDLEGIDSVLDYIEEKLIENNIKHFWNISAKEFNGKEIAKFNLEEMAYLEDALRYIDMIVMWEHRYIDKITNCLGDIIPLNKLDWYNEETYIDMKNNLIVLQEYLDYRESKEYILKFKLRLSDIEFLSPLRAAIDPFNSIEFNKIYKEFKNYEKLVPFVKEYNIYYNKLKEKLPVTCEKLMNAENRSGLKNINKAWMWKQLNALLKRIHDLGIDKLIDACEKENIKEREVIKELAQNKAWYQQCLKTTEEKRKSLYCWLQAVKKIGKGRSKFYTKYLSMAQEEMEKCKDIIPAWIMPINRVFESLTVNQELFDVVIIDESSQCDLSATTLLMRGKRTIIVGDDNQISPQIIGIDNTLVTHYSEAYLKDIPYSRWFDAETNIYTTAQRVFPTRVMLKEHFRCVSEIIGFSNELCYNNEIAPLRGREEQGLIPIKTVFVEEGIRESNKSINIKEADAIVDQIYHCCKDEKYKGMTMGVISMLGEEQGELIQEKLREKIGEAEIINRKLVCGDAYSFQGDERDIILLSMVVSGDLKTRPLTKDVDIKRFNVAASRARNQMWLFHSIDIKNLNPLCVRYKLLNYCQGYQGEKVINQRTGFVQDVYEFLNSKGFKVATLAQNKYGVDFLIEDDKKTIAVQCFGGDLKDIEDQDGMENQKIIATMGWKIFKVRESEFYRNPSGLIEKLQKATVEVSGIIA